MIELTEKVRSGCMDGKVVWVCHYNRPYLNKKPLRCVKPVKCIVVTNDDLPKNKTVYYSKSHYRPIGNNGKPTSKIISPVDNTGFRAHCGNMLYTFTSEEDCFNEWNRQLSNVRDRWVKELETYSDRINKEILSITEEFMF